MLLFQPTMVVVLGFIHKVLPEYNRCKYVSTHLLNYIALAICTYNHTNKCNNYVVVAFNLLVLLLMTTEVLHNTCNMCIRDLPDTNALIPWFSGFKHTYSVNPSCPCYNHYLYPVA